MKRNYFLKALIGSAVIAFASISHAQDAAPAASPSASDAAPGDHGVSPSDYMLRLGAEVGLSDAQIAQIKTIFETSAGQLKTIKEDGSLTDDQKSAQIKALKGTTDQQVNAVLTPEQRQKFAVLLQRFLQHRVDRR
jgi:Spy/CpxP family protein refolding chaperone